MPIKVERSLKIDDEANGENKDPSSTINATKNVESNHKQENEEESLIFYHEKREQIPVYEQKFIQDLHNRLANNDVSVEDVKKYANSTLNDHIDDPMQLLESYNASLRTHAGKEDQKKQEKVFDQNSRKQLIQIQMLYADNLEELGIIKDFSVEVNKICQQNNIKSIDQLLNEPALQDSLMALVQITASKTFARHAAINVIAMDSATEIEQSLTYHELIENHAKAFPLIMGYAASDSDTSSNHSADSNSEDESGTEVPSDVEADLPLV